MLTKDDLKVLQGVIFALEDLKVDNHIINDLVEIYNKCVDVKKYHSKYYTEYNKNNKKYHNLNSLLSYHRKKGNKDKEREILSRLERLKDLYD